MAEKAEKKVNLSQLSKTLQLSQVAIRDWVGKGAPCQRTSRGYLFDVGEVLSWREKYLSEKKQQGTEYEKAKTERMFWLAKRSRLEFEREEGLLVYAKDVKEAAFDAARLLRDQILNIPSRIAPILAAEQDAKKCHEILDKEIRQCLETIANDLVKPEAKNDTNQK